MPNTMQAHRTVFFETPQPVLNARQEAQQSNPVAIDTPQTTPASPRYVAPNATPPKETLFSRLSEMFAPKPQ